MEGERKEAATTDSEKTVTTVADAFQDALPQIPQASGDPPAGVEPPQRQPDTNLKPPDGVVGSSNPVAPSDGKIPDGVMPLFLTGATQNLYKVVNGEDVTEENRFKMIPKADFLADFQTRRAIGDFYPAKEFVTSYPEEQLLLVYDAEWKYGQNFFLCVTVEAKNAILNPIMTAANVPEAVVSQKRSGWNPLGSDKEIEAETVVENRELMTIKLSRKRRFFGSPYRFGDRAASDAFHEIKSTKEGYVLRSQLSRAIQSVSTTCDAAAQTLWFKPVNFSVQYESLKLEDTKRDGLIRHPEFTSAIQSAAMKFERPLRLNAIMDIFKDDYATLGEEDVALDQGSYTLQEYQSFTDLKHSKDRSITCVDWYPAQKGIVAMSCTQRSTLYERIEAGFANRSRKALILIWSFYDPIHPQLMLEAPDDVLCFQFHPQDPIIVVGGCINGQVVLWDLAEHQERLKQGRKDRTAELTETGKDSNVEIPILRYTVVSSIEHSHRGPITDISWLNKSFELNKIGELVEPADLSQKQFYTTSIDGQICFWDLRYKTEIKLLDLIWRPLFKSTLEYGILKLSLRPPMDKSARQSSDGSMSAAARAAESTSTKDSSKEKDNKSPMTKFFCATEEGEVVFADWVSEKEDKDGAFCRIDFAAGVHFAPMSDLSRSQFFPEIVLSVGGWSFHIWKEKLSNERSALRSYFDREVRRLQHVAERRALRARDKAVWEAANKSPAKKDEASISGNPGASKVTDVDGEALEKRYLDWEKATENGMKEKQNAQ
ncbi:WD repeat-containing protein 63 [Gonapodya sp. JEL0774]|nr:WD repeat-containing protein 63 [Gonapodya sp. JEL0774]